MKSIESIIEASQKFYSDLKDDPNARYRSWEHCYLDFYKARNNTMPNYEYLSLQLSFYLASWGMYRGSSFLLQKDYKIHIPIIEEILKAKYNPLMGIDCCELKKEDNMNLLFELGEYIKNYYNYVRRSVRNQNIKSDISDTLLTKILMGTLGCVPAYDRYFIKGIKKERVAIGNYNMKSILQLIKFYEEYSDKLNLLQEQLIVDDLKYPQMKILDMAFWQIGYDEDMK